MQIMRVCGVYSAVISYTSCNVPPTRRFLTEMEKNLRGTEE